MVIMFYFCFSLGGAVHQEDVYSSPGGNPGVGSELLSSTLQWSAAGWVEK